MSTTVLNSIILVFCGFCSAQTTPVVGVYELKASPNYYRLELRYDSTFEYLRREDLCKDTLMVGTWQLKGGTITLFPSVVETKYVSRNTVIEEFRPAIPGTEFKVLIDSAVSVMQVYIHPNGGEKGLQADDAGILTTRERGVRSFIVSSIAGRDFDYKVRRQDTNYFIIYLHYDSGVPCDWLTFTKEFKVVKDKLYPKDDNRRSNSREVYRKLK